MRIKKIEINALTIIYEDKSIEIDIPTISSLLTHNKFCTKNCPDNEIT
jgi:hypothetical protein